MRHEKILRALAVLAVLLAVAAGPAAAKGTAKGHDETKCKMTFSLNAWAAAYEHATGSGTITCEDGQSANVDVSLKAVGLTAGKYHVDGKGEFSKIHKVSELYGSYAAAEGNAGVVKAGQAAVVTKGKVSLALSGTGEGWNVGVSLGKFQLTPSKG